MNRDVFSEIDCWGKELRLSLMAFGQDPLSARSHALSRQAEVLERDILSGRPASADVADSVPNPDSDDRR